MISIFDACRTVKAVDAAREIGLRFGRGGRAYCPFCGHDPPTISFSKGLFHCYCCGAAGDAVKLIELTQELSPIDAARWINRQFGCGFEDNGKISDAARDRIAAARKERERKEANERLRRKYMDDICWAESVLRDENPQSWETMTPQFIKCLNKNCFFDAIWDAITSRDFEPGFPLESEAIAIGEIRGTFTGRAKLANDKSGDSGANSARSFVKRKSGRSVRKPFKR